MEKTIFLLITIIILVFSVHSNAADVKEPMTQSSENPLLLSEMLFMQSAQVEDFTYNIDMGFVNTQSSCFNMGWDANFENGVNVEMLLYSSTCTCMCRCQRCTVSTTCYQPGKCGSCDSMCEETCMNFNCGSLVSSSGDCY